MIKISKEDTRIMYSGHFNFWYTSSAKGPGCESFNKVVTETDGRLQSVWIFYSALVDIGLWCINFNSQTCTVKYIFYICFINTNIIYAAAYSVAFSIKETGKFMCFTIKYHINDMILQTLNILKFYFRNIIIVRSNIELGPII